MDHHGSSWVFMDLHAVSCVIMRPHEVFRKVCCFLILKIYFHMFASKNTSLFFPESV